MIDDDPEGFLKMMDQVNLGTTAAGAASHGGGGAAATPPGTITVQLSPKDRAAIANVRICFIRMERDEIVRGSNLVDSGR